MSTVSMIVIRNLINSRIMIEELLITILKLFGAVLIIGVIGVIMAAGVAFIYSIIEDIYKSKKLNEDGENKLQDNIRPKE